VASAQPSMVAGMPSGSMATGRPFPLQGVEFLEDKLTQIQELSISLEDILSQEEDLSVGNISRAVAAR